MRLVSLGIGTYMLYKLSQGEIGFLLSIPGFEPLNTKSMKKYGNTIFSGLYLHQYLDFN